MPRAVADIVFPLSAEAPRLVTSAEIIQREFQHDLARVRIRGELPTYPEYRSNTPVELTYGWEGDTALFYGYVHHVEPNAGRTGQSLTVVCIGASYPLKQRRQRVYRDMTVTDVARKVADRHRLDADLDPHTQMRSAITQAGESDWEFLVRLAKEIGYVCYVNQTQLRFHARTRDIQSFRSSAPRFRYETASGDADQGDVRSFASRIGETLPNAGRRADRRAYGVDPRTVGIIEARNNGELRDVLGVETADPFFDYYESDLVIHADDEGEARLDGMTEDNRFHITAQANVRGNVRTRQAMPVYFDQLPEDYGGYWFVHGVTHSITPDVYMMDLELGRDSLQVADTLPAGRARRDLSFLPTKGGRSRVNATSSRPGTVLRSTTGGKRKPAGGKGKKKTPTTRTPVKGKGKITPTAVGKKQPGQKSTPPRGARNPAAPKPVRSSTPRTPPRPAVSVSKSDAYWQATHRAQPVRSAPPAPRPAAVTVRLGKVDVRGR